MSKAETTAIRALADAAPLFAALGDGTRIELLLRLSGGGAHSIARLSDGSSLTRQAVTRHLTVLQEAGLVRGRRRGREHVWELRPRSLALAHSYLDMIAASGTTRWRG
jgi:DNA-binding transcriptional ArsR family regulator